MVLPGQFLERPTLIPVGDLVLEGLFHKGKRGGAIVAPPHPQFGGSMENPVVAEAVFALYRAGYSTLRFNFRGVGASQGEITGDPEKGVEDYLAAMKVEIENTGAEKLTGGGYSYGAYITYLAYIRKAPLERLILISPPNKLFDMNLDKISIPSLIICGDRDNFCYIDPEKEKNPYLKVEIIRGADHFYVRGLGTIGNIIAEWLKEE